MTLEPATELGAVRSSSSSAGASSVPIRTTRGDGWASSNDLDVISEWDWSRANAYGIDCGKSGLLVVDVDPEASWPFTGTRVHGTGRGEHFIYTNPGDFRNKVHLEPWGVDIRGVKGMIVGPGSWHPHGSYTIELDIDPVPPPEELTELLAQQTPAVPAEEMGELDPLLAIEQLERLYEGMRKIQPGERNDQLNKRAGVAGGLWVRLNASDQKGVLAEDHIKAELLAAVTDDDDVEGSRKTIRSGWSHGLANPVADPESAMTIASSFFDQTDELKAIRQWAHSRGIGAPMVLANVLARVLLEAPVGWVLPPTIGAPAPLNLGFIMVGHSSAGKSASAHVAAELLGRPDDRHVLGTGSGEGIADCYLDYDADKALWIDGIPPLVENPAFLFKVDEIEEFNRVSERTSSTTTAALKTAVSGGALSNTNTRAGGRKRHVDAMAYRFVMTIAAQPELTGPMLAGGNSGVPQRFLWIAMRDPELPKTVEDQPSQPEPLGWLEDWRTHVEFLDEHRVVAYPERIAREIRQTNLDLQHRTDTDELDGHLNLARIKVAAALAFLHREVDITEQWWELAGVLTEASRKVMGSCQAAMAAVAVRKSRTAGRLEAVKKKAEADSLEEMDAAEKRILEIIEKCDGEATRRDLSQGMPKRLRGELDTTLAGLEQKGLIEMKETTSSSGRPKLAVMLAE